MNHLSRRVHDRYLPHLFPAENWRGPLPQPVISHPLIVKSTRPSNKWRFDLHRLNNNSGTWGRRKST